MKLKFTNAARQDLQNIFAYTKKVWGVDQARQYSQNLKTHITGLSQDRSYAKPVSLPINHDLKQTSCGKHIVIFEHQPNAILIVRILHEAMDLPRHLINLN